MEQALTGKKFGRGYVEPTAVDSSTFDEQYQSYQRSGYALDVSTAGVIGDYNAFLNESREIAGKKRRRDSKVRGALPVLADNDGEDLGPWALYKDDDEPEEAAFPPVLSSVSAQPASMTPAAVMTVSSSSATAAAAEEDTTQHIVEPELEDEKWEKINERKQNFILPPRPARGTNAGEARSIFHGDSAVDFQGRSWTAAPQGVRADTEGEHECYLPKKTVKRLTGHTKGVQTIEFFPGTGHLLLSSSMDGKCKVWDAQESYAALRTYIGHAEGIRSSAWNSTGSQFLSSAFDRYIRLWDTETGQAVATFSNRKMAYCVKFFPRDNNLFLAASSDNKIYEWDIRTGEICQEYNYHLQPCNTVLFIDGGKKFVSTSDDKKVLVWEFGIPVPIKYIQEPDMHSMPFLAHHPKEEVFVGQSMNNTIAVYAGGDRVKCIRKRVFRGHNNSGYACQVGFSPNGKYLQSGDGLGSLYIWEWRTTKIFRKFQAHEGGPCMGAIWHPLHPSRVATCGWDGLIKIWE